MARRGGGVEKGTNKSRTPPSEIAEKVSSARIVYKGLFTENKAGAKKKRPRPL